LRKTLLLSAVLGLLIPASAYAYDISGQSMSILCSVLPCSGAGGGAMGLSVYIFDKIVTALEVGIVAATILALFVSATQMVVLGQDEGAVTSARKSYIYIITGLAVTGLARWLVKAFSPTETGAALTNPTIYESGIANIVTYFRLIIAITLSMNIVVQAFRLLSSQGESEQADKAKNRLISGFVGAGIIMIANAIVVALEPSVSGAHGIAVEIAGVANYLITFLGFLAVVVIGGAGVALIISVDDSFKDKAKQMIKTAVVVLIFVVLAYALITAFISI
jgi:hypothetical protein